MKNTSLKPFVLLNYFPIACSISFFMVTLFAVVKFMITSQNNWLYIGSGCIVMGLILNVLVYHVQQIIVLNRFTKSQHNILPKLKHQKISGLKNRFINVVILSIAFSPCIILFVVRTLLNIDFEWNNTSLFGMLSVYILFVFGLGLVKQKLKALQFSIFFFEANLFD
ncbi:MAG: hypothetical protein ACPG6V_11285 [Flavobacteriales bacterium]